VAVVGHHLDKRYILPQHLAPSRGAVLVKAGSIDHNTGIVHIIVSACAHHNVPSRSSRGNIHGVLLENILPSPAEHNDFVGQSLNGNVKSRGCTHSTISAEYGNFHWFSP